MQIFAEKLRNKMYKHKINIHISNFEKTKNDFK